MKKLFLLLLLSLGLASISYAANTIITTPKKMTDSQLRGWYSMISYNTKLQKNFGNVKPATQPTYSDAYLALTPDQLAPDAPPPNALGGGASLAPAPAPTPAPAPAPPPPAEEAPAEEALAEEAPAPGSDMGTPAPGVPTAASIKAEAVRIAEEKSAAESEASPDAPTAASIAAKADAVRIAAEKSAAESESAREEMSAAEAEALRIDEMNAPAPTPGKLTPDQLAAAPAPATDQLTPASAPAPANDGLCGAEESTNISDGVNISCSGDVEITEAPAPEATGRPDMFSTAVVKYATTVTEWAEMGIPADITKKYLNDPTAGGKCDHECMMNIPTADSNAAKAESVAAAEAASAASAAAAIGAVTAALNEAKAASVAAGEAASAADAASACSRLPEGETADYC